MLTRILLLSSLIVTSVTAGLPAADSPLIDDAQLGAVGMYRFWQARLPLAGGDVVQEGHLVDDALYIITEGGTLFALTAQEGLIRWAEKLSEKDYKIYRPAHIPMGNQPSPVIIPTTTQVFIYDRFSGDLLQRFTPEFPPGSPILGYGSTLFMGSANGRFYSLIRDLSCSTAPRKLWEVLAGGPVTAAPVLYGQGALLFASQSGTVFSCRAVDKTLFWTYRTGGPILGDPFVDAGGIYVASTDRSLYKLHPGTGRAMWRFRMPRPLLEGPVVVAHMVFQYCPTKGLSAIDADSGQQRWRIAEGRSFVAHSRNGDFIFTHDRRLLLVDHQSGDVGHSIAVPAAVGAARNVRGDTVYLLGRDGRVLCARLDDVPYLRRQEVMAARNRLHLPPSTSAPKTASAKTPAETDPLANDPLRSRRDVKP